MTFVLSFILLCIPIAIHTKIEKHIKKKKVKKNKEGEKRMIKKLEGRKKAKALEKSLASFIECEIDDKLSLSIRYPEKGFGMARIYNEIAAAERKCYIIEALYGYNPRSLKKNLEKWRSYVDRISTIIENVKEMQK